MRSKKVRSILAPSPDRLHRRDDLIYEYGMTRSVAYDLWISLDAGLYIKWSVLERVLEGAGKLVYALLYDQCNQTSAEAP